VITKTKKNTLCKSIFFATKGIAPCTHVRKVKKQLYMFFKYYSDAQKYVKYQGRKLKIMETDRFGNQIKQDFINAPAQN